jgi:hypothetical protein
LSGFAEFGCRVWMVMSVLLSKSFSQLEVRTVRN